MPGLIENMVKLIGKSTAYETPMELNEYLTTRLNALRYSGLSYRVRMPTGIYQVRFYRQERKHLWLKTLEN